MAYGVALNQIPNLMVCDSSLVFRSQIRNINNGKSYPPSSWIEVDAEEGPSWRVTPTRGLLSQRGREDLPHWAIARLSESARESNT